MKTKTLIFFICLYLSSQGFCQNTLSVNKLMVQTAKIQSTTDSLNRTVYRTDSLDMVIFIVFNDLTKEIGEMTIKIGKSKDDHDLFNKRITVIKQEQKYFMKEDGKALVTLNYGKNLVLRYRIKNDDDLNWLMFYFEDARNKTESDKYYSQIKK